MISIPILRSGTFAVKCMVQNQPYWTVVTQWDIQSKGELISRFPLSLSHDCTQSAAGEVYLKTEFRTPQESNG